MLVLSAVRVALQVVTVLTTNVEGVDAPTVLLRVLIHIPRVDLVEQSLLKTEVVVVVLLLRWLPSYVLRTFGA